MNFWWFGGPIVLIAAILFAFQQKRNGYYFWRGLFFGILLYGLLTAGIYRIFFY